MEGDERGRIPLWSEEKNDALLPGRREGKLALDPDVRLQDKTSVRLTRMATECAISSVNYPVAPWTEHYEVSGWTRTESSASAQILACWLDDAQQVLRVDASKLASDAEWRRVALTPPAPPANAMSVRLVAVARGGSVWFDDFELLRMRPRERRIKVFVNPVGYDQAGPKSAVVAANFLPESGTELGFQLLTPNGKIVRKQSVACAGRLHGSTTNDWGWYFWRADFSDFRHPGVYRVEARAAGTRGGISSIPNRTRHFGEGNSAKRRGLFLHSTLRVRCSGMAQGLSSRRCEVAGRHAH